MELKHIKPLFVAAVINFILGVFLLGSGILEFTGLMKTEANTTIRTIGVQLSHLVFVSGVLVFASGGLTILFKKKMSYIDLQIFIGVVSLAWPIFVSISLLFVEKYICIRLIPTILSSLFYMITVLVVKISNEALRKSHAFNPSAQLANMGKRKQRIDVSRVFTGSQKKHTSVNISSISVFFQRFQKKNHTSIANKLFFQKNHRRRGGGFANLLYGGSRRRGKFRIRK